MSEPKKKSPNLSYQALALMSRLFYEKYGNDALPIIRQVWYKMGISSGERLKKQTEYDFRTAADVIIERDKKIGYKGMYYEISEDAFRNTTSPGHKCDVGLEGAGLPICKAIMSLDQGQLKSIFGHDVELEILHSLAAGDDYCDIILRPSNAPKSDK